LAYDTQAKKMMPLYRFMAASHEDADLVRDQWAKANDDDPERIIAHPDSAKRYGQPAGSQPAPARPATQGVNWEIRRDRDNTVVHRFSADDQDDAITKANDFMRMQGWNINDYTVQAIESTTPPANRITPTGPGPWELYSRSNNNAVYRLGHTQRPAAQTEAETWLRQHNQNTEDYGIRTRQTTTANNTAPWWYVKSVDTDHAPGEIIHRYQAPDVSTAYNVYRQYIQDHDLDMTQYMYGRAICAYMIYSKKN
jgi:hypothetical protein